MFERQSGLGGGLEGLECSLYCRMLENSAMYAVPRVVFQRVIQINLNSAVLQNSVAFYKKYHGVVHNFKDHEKRKIVGLGYFDVFN